MADLDRLEHILELIDDDIVWSTVVRDLQIDTALVRSGKGEDGGCPSLNRPLHIVAGWGVSSSSASSKTLAECSNRQAHVVTVKPASQFGGPGWIAEWDRIETAHLVPGTLEQGHGETSIIVPGTVADPVRPGGVPMERGGLPLHVVEEPDLLVVDDVAKIPTAGRSTRAAVAVIALHSAESAG
jgi:hypothetical protein